MSVRVLLSLALLGSLTASAQPAPADPAAPPSGEVPTPPVDVPAPSVDPDPAHWQKRFHGSADPGRTVHLHIREHGSPAWRCALLFRDWLRAEPAEAAAYEAEKMRLASMHETSGAYAEAREPWFEAALPRAEEWARRVGWSPSP